MTLLYSGCCAKRSFTAKNQVRRNGCFSQRIQKNRAPHLCGAQPLFAYENVFLFRPDIQMVVDFSGLGILNIDVVR